MRDRYLLWDSAGEGSTLTTVHFNCLRPSFARFISRVARLVVETKHSLRAPTLELPKAEQKRL